jgi:hypothetical protein
MNDKGKLITEKDVEELALNLYKEKVRHSQEKEKFISQLPYADEYPRLMGSKVNSCHTIILRSFYISGFFCLIYGFIYTHIRYSKKKFV